MASRVGTQGDLIFKQIGPSKLFRQSLFGSLSLTLLFLSEAIYALPSKHCGPSYPFLGLILNIRFRAGLNGSFTKLYKLRFMYKKPIWAPCIQGLDLREQVLDSLHGLWRVRHWRIRKGRMSTLNFSDIGGALAPRLGYTARAL